VTTERPAADQAPTLPPDPEAYDSERNAMARARGLAAPYIAGGRDPDPEATRRQERIFVRLLVVMIATIVLGGFVLGIIANIIGLSRLAGG
jgi:hypothetical protein